MGKTCSYGAIGHPGELEILVIKPAEKALWHRCESLEYRVFLESGYVEANPMERIAIFDRYASMKFLAAFAGDRRLPLDQRFLSGVIRLVYAPGARKMGPGLFPTIDHAEELAIAPDSLKRVLVMDPGLCVDIASMAIAKENRDGKASRALIEAVIAGTSERPRVRYGFAAIDTDFYRKLKERRLPFGDLGPSVTYMGSMSTAAMIDVFMVWRGLRRIFIPLLKFRGLWSDFFAGDRSP